MHIGKNVVAELKRIEVERIRSDNALLLQPLDARGNGRRGQPHFACKGLDRSAGVFLQQAQQAGKFTAMDTAWDFEDVWMDKIRESIAYLDLFMPSYDEAAKLTGEKDPSRIAALFKKLGAKNVIIKLGTQGALVCPLGQEERLIPAYLCEHPADTTGAGDSFAAGLLAGLAQGWNQYESARFANAVGAHCVAAVGATAGIRSIDETLDFMRRADAAKIKERKFYT